MDPRLLRHYDRELAHLREMGAEFAQAFPKVAARLGMDGTEVRDPYVERLLEGTAFLAARVQLRLEAEFPRFTQRLLEIVHPTALAPTPAMLVAQLCPDPDDPNLARGVAVPRGSSLRATLGRGDTTACEFRTAHPVVLWPIEIARAAYFGYAPELPLAAQPWAPRVRGGVRLRLRATAGLSFEQIEATRLRLFLGGADEIAHKLQELCLGAPLGVMVGPGDGRPGPWEALPAAAVQPVGFADDEALLPAGLRLFQGHRLLQEYFAFPARFLFIDIEVGEALRRCGGAELELAVLLERGDAALERVVDASQFALHCVPAINLFPKRADRIQVGDGAAELHVVADRTRPMDFEVFDVTGVTGYGTGNERVQEFRPFYAMRHGDDADQAAYFTLQREPRLPSDAQRRRGPRSGYVGSEAFIALVDPSEAPYGAGLRQLAVDTLCTNRDLPLLMPLGVGDTDFTLEIAAPVRRIRCVKGPSRPCSPLAAEGAAAWRLVSLLAMNYATLLDGGGRDAAEGNGGSGSSGRGGAGGGGGGGGAQALRELLALHACTADAGMRRQVDGVRSVRIEPTVRRLPDTGPLAFGRGLRIVVGVDELAFQGMGAFLLGAVLERFFARYVSINSFTETVLSSAHGEIQRFAPRWGARPVA